jgi:hypothetical protein
VVHSQATASGNPFNATMETTTANLGQDIASAAAVAIGPSPPVARARDLVAAGSVRLTAGPAPRPKMMAHVAPTEAARVCGNPLRDEPDPVVVAAVKRFGLVGLVVCAVSAGLGRWWSTVAR